MKSRHQSIARYVIQGEQVEVDHCFQGPEDDQQREKHYEVFDSKGNHLNHFERWADDGTGVPSAEVVTQLLTALRWVGDGEVYITQEVSDE